MSRSSLFLAALIAVSAPASAQTPDASTRARAAQAKVAGKLGRRSPEVAAVAVRLGEALLAEGRPQEALDAVRQALPGAIESLGAGDAITANLTAVEGSALVALGRDAEAEPTLARAVAALSALGRRDAAAPRALRLSHAAVLERLDRDAEAEGVARGLLAGAELPPGDAAAAWRLLGAALAAQGRAEEAGEAEERAARLSSAG
jgi:tetratricopeptide (TPR) repeat protein